MRNNVELQIYSKGVSDLKIKSRSFESFESLVYQPFFAGEDLTFISHVAIFLRHSLPVQDPPRSSGFRREDIWRKEDD